MQVRLWNTIVVKLFLLISLCSVITLIGITLLTSKSFRQHLERQTNDNLQSQTEETANVISFVIENIITQSTLFVHQSEKTGDQAFNSLLQANKDFLHVQVFNIAPGKNPELGYSKFSPYKNRVEFGDKNADKIKEKIETQNRSYLPDVLKQNLKEPRMVSLVRVLDLPVFQVILHFSVQGKNESRIVFLTVWSTRILKSLPKNRTTSSYVLQKPDRILFAHNLETMKQPMQKISAFNFANDVMKQNLSSAFKQYGNEGKNSKDPLLGAISKLESFDLYVLIEKDANSVFMNINSIIRKTLLWGVLFVLLAIMLSFISSRSVSKIIEMITHATVRIAKGKFDFLLPVKRKDELGVLSSAINTMARQIVSLLDETKKSAELQKEVETAEAVQATVFPKDSILESKLLKFCGKTRVASRCGGDWWGFYNTEGDCEVLLIGDATGHGVSAALVTTMAFAACSAYFAQRKENPELPLSPAGLLRQVNDTMCRAGQGKTTMTLFALIFDPKTKEIIFSNAGHNFPYILKKDGAKTSLKALVATGNPLGIEAGSLYEDMRGTVEAGEKIFLYTDGIPEVYDPQGNQLGKKNFTKLIQASADRDPSEMLDDILRGAMTHARERNPDDDMTAVVAIFKGFRAVEA